MSAAQAGQQQQEPQAVQAGSRWLHRMPTEEQVKGWFDTNSLHEGMAHAPYYGGIVVINATEKYKVTKQKANGDTYVAEVERAVFTPYVKVDTRIAYFWELVRQMNVLGRAHDSDPDRFVGVIEPAEVPRITDVNSPYYNGHLPEGYFVQPIKNRDETVSRFLAARWRVAIYERESYAAKLKGGADMPVLQGIGTKQSPLAKNWADDNVLMKVETGAIGRALGVAGILVVGTGVATAEDMQEAQAGPTGAAASASAEPALPDVVSSGGNPDAQGARIEGPQVSEGQAMGPAVEEPETPQQADEKLREQAKALNEELKAASEEAHGAYLAWYRQRGFPTLSELTGPALRGAVVKLERTLAEVQEASG